MAENFPGSSAYSTYPPEANDFFENGYLVIREAFSSEVAAQCRKIISDKLAEEGINLLDNKSWMKRKGIAETYYESDGRPWCDVFTTKLKNSVDNLCGTGRWRDFGCGWWVITFPFTSEPPWRVEGKWHVDGHWFQHFPFSKEVGIVPVMLFSDIFPQGGGTVVSIGSHVFVSNMILDCGLRGCSNSEIASTVLQNHPHLTNESNILELTGRAGDVFLLHPHLLHARSTNFGDFGADSIRFMCHPSVSLKDHMDFSVPLDCMTVLERSIFNACSRNSDLLTRITPVACEEFLNAKAKRHKRVRFNMPDVEHDDNDRASLVLAEEGNAALDNLASNDINVLKGARNECPSGYDGLDLESADDENDIASVMGFGCFLSKRKR